MFKIGDIVRPKKCYKGHNYCFKVIEIQKEPFVKDLYRIQRIEQELDADYSPTFQLNIIKTVEQCLWEEDELELTSDVKLRYKGTVTNIDDIVPASFDFDKFTKELIKSCEIKSCEIKIDKINKEENEMQILDLYEERKVKALEKELLEAKGKIKEEDEIQSIILEMTNQVNTILENQGREIKYEFQPNLITLETELKLDELNDKFHEQIEELRSTLDEIRALFELTDDYDERIKILKNYKILNKDGKLSI